MKAQLFLLFLICNAFTLAAPKSHGTEPYTAGCYGTGDCTPDPATEMPDTGSGGGGGMADFECWVDSQCPGGRCLDGVCALAEKNISLPALPAEETLYGLTLLVHDAAPYSMNGTVVVNTSAARPRNVTLHILLDEITVIDGEYIIEKQLQLPFSATSLSEGRYTLVAFLATDSGNLIASEKVPVRGLDKEEIVENRFSLCIPLLLILVLLLLALMAKAAGEEEKEAATEPEKT